MKRICILIITVFLVPCIVNAKTITNKNNLKIDEDVYNKLCEIFPKEFVDSLDEDRYNAMMVNNLTDIKIATSNPISLMSTIIDNPYKTLTITKVGDLITINLSWKNEPKYHSYDVIGYRYTGSILTDNNYFQQIYNTSNVSNENSPKSSYGIGYGTSFKLQNGLEKNILLSFRYTGTGVIYASYQHATANVSLVTSRDYSLSSNGYGKVFKFSDSSKNYYDNMIGVYLSV